MENCVFCKIVNGQLPSSKIYEDDKVLAFLDIEPVNVGHTLVISKKHYVNIYDMPEAVLLDVMKVAQRVAKAIKNIPADGVNVTMNNDPAAGQVVFHSHIHVIPRLKDDGFGLWKGKKGYKDGEREKIVEKITENLS